MKISLITTVFNEAATIERFLNSILDQSKQPDEIIITDGGSKDDTVEKISNFKFPISKEHVKVIVKKGNRSIGRNEAIRQATGEVIVCSDAGNILDKDWIKQITEPFHREKQIDVVAGYYKGIAKNVFQKCLIPYVLVMPDKVNPDTFLPATRSVAFTKNIWQKVGGFDEKLSHNEDYAFAHALKNAGAKIVFKKDAIVKWIPRNTLKEAYIMFLRFAYGDAEAGIWRKKVIFLYVRYIVGLILLLFGIITFNNILLYILLTLFILYLLWAVQKNYNYVRQWKSIYYLPLLQLTADTAVLIGTLSGKFHLWDTEKMH